MHPPAPSPDPASPRARCDHGPHGGSTGGLQGFLPPLPASRPGNRRLEYGPCTDFGPHHMCFMSCLMMKRCICRLSRRIYIFRDFFLPISCFGVTNHNKTRWTTTISQTVRQLMGPMRLNLSNLGHAPKSIQRLMPTFILLAEFFWTNLNSSNWGAWPFWGTYPNPHPFFLWCPSEVVVIHLQYIAISYILNSFHHHSSLLGFCDIPWIMSPFDLNIAAYVPALV